MSHCEHDGYLLLRTGVLFRVYTTSHPKSAGIDSRMDGQIDVWVEYGWMDEWVDFWIDGCMDLWIDGSMDG